MNLIKSWLFPPSLPAQEKSIMAPWQKTSVKQNCTFLCPISLYPWVGNQPVHACFSFVEILTGELPLMTYFNNWGACGISPTQWKVVPIKSHAEVKITSLPYVMSLPGERKVQGDASADNSKRKTMFIGTKAQPRSASPQMQCLTSLTILTGVLSLVSSFRDVVEDHPLIINQGRWTAPR